MVFSVGRLGVLMNNLGDNIILYDFVVGEFIVMGYGDWFLVDL